MSVPGGIEIRPLEMDEFPEMARHVSRALGFSPPTSDWLEAVGADHDPSRSLGALDGGRLVGSTHAHLFDLTLPGATQIPAAGVTAVAVAATHRRRGILRSLMERQLTECRERGEPVAILIASESVIYGRFGYGLASTMIDVEVDPRHGRFARPLEVPGRLVTVDDEAADKIFPEVYERFRLSRPGAINRLSGVWELARRQRKPGELTHVVYEDADGAVQGFVSYKIKGTWDSAGLADGHLTPNDFTTATTEALAALWHHLLNVDLVTKVSAPARPTDEPLRWLLADPRRMKVTRFSDFLWLRPLDVERLLSSRAYRSDDRLALGVRDAMFPALDGVYAVEPGSCARTDAEPDIELPIAELGAVSLGGTSFSELARVGRIVERTPGALARADAMFSSEPKPYGNTFF